MRAKLTLAAALVAGLFAFGAFAPTASAHPPGSYGYYYGNGAHDFVPHWHVYNTPFGAQGYYGLGAHDFMPHGHVYDYQPSYGGYSPGYAEPYGYGASYSYGYRPHHG